MTFSIVVVCSANVCRSPVTVALLRKRLCGSPVGDSVHLTSCGEHAWTDLATCPEVAGTNILAPDEFRMLQRHRPVQLTRHHTDYADLILTADRSVRSSVVRLDPRVHDRTFTIREAAALASHALTSAVVPPHPTVADSMRWLTAEMNDSRGLTRLPGVGHYRRTGFPWPRLPVHGHDVPDAHDDSGVPHRVVRELIVSATDVLARSFMRSAQCEPEPHRP